MHDIHDDEYEEMAICRKMYADHKLNFLMFRKLHILEI